MTFSIIARVGALALALALAGPLAAQQPGAVANPEGLYHTRAELEALLHQLEQSAEASGESGEMRQHARLSAARVRQRLEDGDFRPGDRIMLEVRLEPDLTGEFTVEPGRTVTLPEVGTVSLDGVLRSELEGHLREALGRYLLNPTIRAQALIRVAVVGEVGSPGFFTLPASLVLEDVVMRAGGPTRNADLDKIRVERAGETIWRDRPLRQAMLEAHTMDQLSLQAGDRIVVPARGTPLLSGRGILTALTTIGSLMWLYTRIFD